MREARFRSNVEIYRNKIAIAIAEDVDAAPSDRLIAAKAADNLLRVEGIEASFAAIRIGDTLHISGRSADKVNVQLIMEELGGGGHFAAAAAQIREKSAAEVLPALKAAIDKHLKD